MKLLYVFIFMLLGFTKSHCQFVEKQRNVYLYNNNKLFSIEWERESKKPLMYIDTLSPLNTFIIKNDSDQFITYLGEDWSIHFLVIGKDTNVLESHRYIEDSNGKKFFPREVYQFSPAKNIRDIVTVFYEGDGPIFKLIIYRWDFNKRIIETNYASKSYFSYPSWNPFIEKENIKISNNQISIPFCEGCQSGKDGSLKWDTLNYDSIKKEYLME